MADDGSGPRRDRERDRLALALSYVEGRKRAEEALGFLGACSGELAAMLSCEEWVPEIGARCVPFLADCCRIAVHPVAGEPPVVSVRHSRRTSPEEVERMIDFLVLDAPASSGCLADAVEQREPVVYSDADATPFRASGFSLAAARREGVGSGLTIPLRSHGVDLGSFSLARRLDRPHVDGAAFALAFELCRHLAAAAAIDRLHREVAELEASAAVP